MSIADVYLTPRRCLFAKILTSLSSRRDHVLIIATVFQDELTHYKSLLGEAERSRQDEVEQRKEASAQVIKLTELKALLQQQLEHQGGGSVADKQVRRKFRDHCTLFILQIGS